MFDNNVMDFEVSNSVNVELEINITLISIIKY